MWLRPLLLLLPSVVWAINYRCQNDQVLVVQSFGNDTIRMHCQRLDLCGYQKLRCDYDEHQPQCGGQMNFVAHVHQSSSTSPVEHTCCNLFNPRPPHMVTTHAGNDCFIYELPDGSSVSRPKEEGDSPLTVLKSAAEIPEHIDGVSGYRLRLFLLKNKAPPTLLVKGIERRLDGYRVTICRPRCTSVAAAGQEREARTGSDDGSEWKAISWSSWTSTSWTTWAHSASGNYGARTRTRQELGTGATGANGGGQGAAQGTSGGNNNINIDVDANGNNNNEWSEGAKGGGFDRPTVNGGDRPGTINITIHTQDRGSNGSNNGGPANVVANASVVNHIHNYHNGAGGEGEGSNGGSKGRGDGGDGGDKGGKGKGSSGGETDIHGDGDAKEIDQNRHVSRRPILNGGNGLGSGEDGNLNGNGGEGGKNGGKDGNKATGHGGDNGDRDGTGNGITDGSNGGDGPNGNKGGAGAKGGKGNDKNKGGAGGKDGDGLGGTGGDGGDGHGGSDGENGTKGGPSKNGRNGENGSKDKTGAGKVEGKEKNGDGNGGNGGNGGEGGDGKGNGSKGKKNGADGNGEEKEKKNNGDGSGGDGDLLNGGGKADKDGSSGTGNGGSTGNGENGEDGGNGGANGANGGDGGNAGKTGGGDNGNGDGGNGGANGANGGSGAGNGGKNGNGGNGGNGAEGQNGGDGNGGNEGKSGGNGANGGTGGKGTDGSNGADGQKKGGSGTDGKDGSSGRTGSNGKDGEEGESHANFENGPDEDKTREQSRKPVGGDSEEATTSAGESGATGPSGKDEKEAATERKEHEEEGGSGEGSGEGGIDTEEGIKTEPPAPSTTPSVRTPSAVAAAKQAKNNEQHAQLPTPTQPDGPPFGHHLPQHRSISPDNNNIQSSPTENNGGGGGNSGETKNGNGNKDGGTKTVPKKQNRQNAPANDPAGGPSPNAMMDAMKKMNCFAADSLVTTVTGKKRMDQLQVGDFVLVPSAGNVLKYERVEMFYHREPETRAQFVVLLTKTGRRMALTPLHLLPFGECSAVEKLIGSSEGVETLLGASRFARSAKIGECVLTIDENGELVADRIVKIGRQVSEGIYSPMTVEGALIVDGVLASCFSQLESHSVQKTVFDFLMFFNDLFGIGYGRPVDEQGVPSFVNYVHSLSQYVLPFAKY